MGAAKFESKIENGVQLIRTPTMLDKNVVTAFEASMNQWLLDPSTLHVFDFAGTVTIDPAFYRFIGAYRRQLAKADKFLVSLNLKESLHREIVVAGMGQAFNSMESMDRARAHAGLPGAGGSAPPKPQRIDSAIISHFVEGTVSALQIQASLPVKGGQPHIKSPETPLSEIAGVITLNNPQMPGSIAICFPKPVFLGIYEAMVGEKHTEISQEIQDAAGEILNIVYGHAKAKLAEKGIKFEMAIPVVLVGEKLRMQMGQSGKSIILPFECKFGRFHIEVYFKKV